MLDDDVERLYGALVDVIQETRPGSFAAPVTVAEIYQDLVPYRRVRASLGYEMNADYEHALLRLLAGVGELARLEPLEAAAELREELDSPNPNVGLFRKFAGCDVWIAPPETPGAGAGAEYADDSEWAPPADRTPEEPETHARFGPPFDAWDQDLAGRARDDQPASDAEQAGSEPAAAAGGAGAAAAANAHDGDHPDAGGHKEDTDESPAAEEEPEYELVPVKRPRIVPSAAAALGGRRGQSGASSGASVTPIDRAAAAHCAFCDGRLPARAHVRFCPYCGNDQTQRPCAECGEPLETEWRYCVACGTAAAPA